MQKLSDWKPGTHRKVFLAGRPKSAGKTTFAMSAPGRKMVFQYDLGSAVIPPGVDPATVAYKNYEAADVNMDLTTDRWKRPQNVGEDIIKDVQALKDGFRKGGPIILDGSEHELPDTIILDGLTEMTSIIVDWILAVNKKVEPEDFIGASGNANNYKLWMKRKEVMRTIFHSVIPLPANVIMIAWEAPEMKDQKATGAILPDIGGALDNMVSGKVDAALRCYASYQGAPKYLVQTQPDGIREWVGVRGAFGLASPIDVTITPANKTLPWDRVFKA